MASEESRTANTTARRVPVLGIVGGIGAGKSAVAQALAARGARMIAADALGHEALRVPAVKAALVERWGAGILNAQGAIERGRVAAIVFRDEPELKFLEQQVFPYIGCRLREEIARAWADPSVRFIVLDAAIMLETGWNQACDRIVFVDAPRQLRYERVARQRGWAEAEIVARERSQMTVDEKRRRADAVVDNSGPPDRLEPQLDRLLETWGLMP